MPITTPRALHAAVGCAFISMIAAFGQSMMLLVVRSFFDPSDSNSWESEGEDFSTIVMIAIVLSTAVAVLLAISAVLTMLLRHNIGRVLLFIATSIAIVVNMGCSCIFNMAWFAGSSEDSLETGAAYYQSPQFTLAVLFGYLAAVAAIVCIILLTQRSVNQYYRYLRQGWV